MNDALPYLPREHGSEAALLAFVLNHPAEVRTVLRDLPISAFDHPHHRDIARLVLQHHGLNRAWDADMITDELLKRTQREDDQIREGATQVLITCNELSLQLTPTTPAALEEHLRRVRAAAETRELHGLLTQCAHEVAQEGVDTEGVLTRVREFRKMYAASSCLTGRLSECLVSNAALHEMAVPERPKLMGDFFREGDLGFIYAPRGVGKTWLAMMLANARAQNQPLGKWEAGTQAGRVLYVDGEMHLADTKMRSAAIGSLSENFLWLHGDLVYARTERTINLCEREWQDHLTELCRARGVTELYLDNLSCLVRGIEENDNDGWRELVLPWLLELRRMKITVIIVAHAGRAEHMRGASGREDAAVWMLKLKPAEAELEGGEEGAAFITEFAKSRNTPGTPPPLLWRIQTPEDGPMACTCELHTGSEVLRRHVLAGVSRNKELAELMSVTPGTISKLAKKAADAGHIVIRNGSYHPPEPSSTSPLHLVA